jgi:RND family efflux transporter MFP subunit
MSANPELNDSAAPLAERQRGELDYAWRKFGAAHNPEEFCQSWLALQCHAIGDVNDAVVVLQKPGSDAFTPLAFWPEGKRDRAALAEVTERVLREGRGVVQPRQSEDAASPDKQPDYQIAYPVRLDGQVRGAVGLDIEWRDAHQLQAAMRQLQWGSGWLEVLLRRHGDPVEAARLRMKLILQLVSAFLERPTLKDAASELATETASQLGCDRVTFGLLQGGGIRIEAVSHAGQFDRHANLLNAAGSAMMEALDQKEMIIFPQDGEARPVVTLAHAELAQMTGAGGVVTVPLAHEGRQVGALTLERAPGLAFDAASVELLGGLGAMLGPLIDLHLARQRTLPTYVAQSARGWWAGLVGPKHAARKLWVGLLVLAMLFAALATGEYRVSADARIEGEVQRALTAPFQGYVREAARRAGDTVQKGEMLARLDDRDMRLERARLGSQREQHGKQYREAMAKRDRALARIVSSQIEQIDAQLALVEEQLTRTEIVAPFDGVVVSGDLSQALGAPLERGQVLFELAPLDAYRVVLQVDEHKVADVSLGQRGELVLASMPNQRYPFTVKKITPVSVAKEGRNFFRIEAQLDAAAGPQLRPGMEGVAKIAVEERHLVSIWTRDLVNWLRLKLWAWTP